MPGVDLNLTLPALDQTMAANTARIAAALSAIEDDLAARVTAGELNINSALDFQGNPAINVGGVRLAGGASSVPGTVFADDAFDLRVVTAAGTVKLTANGAINVAGVGGIGGDYGTGDESEAYDAASQEYRFTASPGVWADLAADDLVLKGDNGSLRLGVESGLSGTKTALFKSLPSSGVSLFAYKAATQTIEDAATLTISNSHTFSDLVATTLMVTTLKHADWTYSFTPTHEATVNAGADLASSLAVQLTPGGGSASWVKTLDNIRAGERLKSASLALQLTSSTTFTYALYKLTHTAAVPTSALITSGSINTTGDQEVTLTVATPTAAAANEKFVLRVTCTAGLGYVRAGKYVVDAA